MKVASIFSDHMVLLRDRKVVIFGEGVEKELITVCLTDMEKQVTETVRTQASAGKWEAVLTEHIAGGKYELTIAGNVDTVIIHDVTFGEVWLAAGQSNMELELQNAQNGENELTESHPEIRYYNVVKSPVADESLDEQEACRTWHICENGDFRDISGIGYYFAKKLGQSLRVPIGIIDCYQGGTSISCWLSKENLLSVPAGLAYHEDYVAVIMNQTEVDYDFLLSEYNGRLTDYFQRVEALRAADPDITQEEINEQAGDYPWPPPMGRKSLFRPYGLYYTMMLRIVPYTIQGVLYYQGEEDAPKTDRYDTLLMKLIEQYRTDFRNPELPFIDLQLPMFMGKHDVEDYCWARTRLAQEAAVRQTENSGLVVLLDLGEFDNVHPVDKETPGTRTATYVLEHIYQESVFGTAMELDTVVRTGGELCLTFRNTYGSVVTKENDLLDVRHAVDNCGSNTPIGFEGSADGTDWQKLSARIDGEKIWISQENAEIHKLRYGYFNYGKVNVYNGAGLPLAPFSTEL